MAVNSSVCMISPNAQVALRYRTQLTIPRIERNIVCVCFSTYGHGKRKRIKDLLPNALFLHEKGVIEDVSEMVHQHHHEISILGNHLERLNHNTTDGGEPR